MVVVRQIPRVRQTRLPTDVRAWFGWSLGEIGGRVRVSVGFRSPSTAQSPTVQLWWGLRTCGPDQCYRGPESVLEQDGTSPTTLSLSVPRPRLWKFEHPVPRRVRGLSWPYDPRPRCRPTVTDSDPRTRGRGGWVIPPPRERTSTERLVLVGTPLTSGPAGRGRRRA